MAEAQESVEKMLQSGEQAREDGAAAAEGEGNAAPPSQHIDFPTAESIAASRPTVPSRRPIPPTYAVSPCARVRSGLPCCLH